MIRKEGWDFSSCFAREVELSSRQEDRCPEVQLHPIGLSSEPRCFGPLFTGRHYSSCLTYTCPHWDLVVLPFRTPPGRFYHLCLQYASCISESAIPGSSGLFFYGVLFFRDQAKILRVMHTWLQWIACSRFFNKCWLGEWTEDMIFQVQLGWEGYFVFLPFRVLVWAEGCCGKGADSLPWVCQRRCGLWRTSDLCVSESFGQVFSCSFSWYQNDQSHVLVANEVEQSDAGPPTDFCPLNLLLGS